MSTAVETATEIRSFHVDIPEEELAELRRRIAATRLPPQSSSRTGRRACSWRRCRRSRSTGRPSTTGARAEAKLNALPQFMTEIDGVDIHFIHVKSRHEDALPLIMTHGWPGSVDRAARDGRPAHRPDRTRRPRRGRVRPRAAVHSRVRLLGRADRARLGPRRIGEAWAELMRRLGYNRYVAQGGDVGAPVTDAMGRQAPEGLIGIHTNLFMPALGGARCRRTPTRNARRSTRSPPSRATGAGYFLEQATRPQTIGYALLDSPVALAAWMLDHDTDSYYKIARAFVDGQPSGNLTRDHILDNITLYWLTGTGASAARSYWESGQPGGRRRPGSSARVAPVRLHDVPRRDLADAAQLGREAPTPTSCTSTRSTRAATSPPGRSRSSSRPRCAPRSGRCADHRSTD